MWARPGPTPRERSLITLALLTAGSHDDEVALHCRTTCNAGATAADIAEAILKVAVYAGVADHHQAIRIDILALKGNQSGASRGLRHAERAFEWLAEGH